MTIKATRYIKWKNAISNYYKNAYISAKISPIPTIVAFLLCFIINMTITLVVWLQARAIHQVSYHDGITFHQLVWTLLLLCFFITLYKFRGNIALPVNRIIDQTVCVSCMYKIIKCVSFMPLQDIYKEEINTRIFKAIEQCGELQDDVLIFADTTACLISIATFAMLMIAYPFGFVYIGIAILCTMAKKMYVVTITERETDTRIRHAKSRQMCEYLFNTLNTKQSWLEEKFINEDEFIKSKWDKEYTIAMNERIDDMRWRLKRSFATECLAELIYAAALILLCYKVINGYIDIAAFAFVFGAVFSFSGLLDRVIKAFERAYKHGSEIEDLLSFIDEDIKEPENNQILTVNIKKDNTIIELKKATFSYRGDEDVIKDVSLSIKNNEIIAVVGPNGSGKSTLINLLLGLSHPDEGSAEICGTDMKNISLAERLHLQGATFQDYARFQFTLRENVGFGYLDLLHDDYALQKAMKTAECRELDSYGNGFDTYLGLDFDKSGVELSGGEWQRIAISRAFLGDRNIIIFDEPTSATDPMFEYRQFHRLKEYLQGKAGILVTHRVGLAGLADKIIFLDNGKIVESGTHETLIAKNGHYAEMYFAQAKWYHDFEGVDFNEKKF